MFSHNRVALRNKPTLDPMPSIRGGHPVVTLSKHPVLRHTNVCPGTCVPLASAGNVAPDMQAVRFPETLRQAKCGICGDHDLLDNAGTDMFGVMSWRCRCETRPLAHSRCVFTLKEKAGRRRTPCPFCRKDMTFGKERASDAQRLNLQVHNPPDVDAKLTDDEYDPPSEVDDDQNDPDYYP